MMLPGRIRAFSISYYSGIFRGGNSVRRYPDRMGHHSTGGKTRSEEFQG